MAQNNTILMIHTREEMISETINFSQLSTISNKICYETWQNVPEMRAQGNILRKNIANGMTGKNSGWNGLLELIVKCNNLVLSRN